MVMEQHTALKEYLEFAITLAQDAGAIIKSALDARMKGGQANVLLKYDNPSDLVTETDQAVEQFIKDRLSATYPSHRFIGEETMAAGTATDFTSDPTWIVDPIDGTTNFVHGYPFVAVSIGLTINKTPVLGVVYNPLLNELYSAAQGLGSYLNRTTALPLFQPPLPLTNLSQCLIATEAGSDRSTGVLDKKVEAIHTLLRRIGHNNGVEAHSVRSTGSAALNICSVAKGCIDVYWEVGCWEWDVTAAMVILQEAGGVVLSGGCQYDEAPANIFGRKYLAIRAAASAPGDDGGGSTRQSQLNIARQMWDVLPSIDAPRDRVPGGFEP